MGRSRRRWTAEEKLEILREGRESGSAVAEVCRRHGVSPGQFYAWEKRAQDGALGALRRKRRSRPASREARLDAQLQELRAAVAELLKENLRLRNGRRP